MKIVDYMIVYEWSAKSLEYLVQAEIKNGWQPYGDMVTRKEYLYQPMVKYEVE